MRGAAVLIFGTTLGAAAVLLTALLAWLAGSLTPWVGVVALLAAAVVAATAVRTASSGVARGPFAAPWSRWQLVAVLAMAGVSVRQFGWLVFERRGTLLTLLPYNYGDLPLHWTYVRYFASGAGFWPENPILTHDRLRYPLGVDLLTAVFAQLGVPLEVALPAMGLAGAALAALALRAWGGAFAIAGLLFAGGLAGIPALSRLSLVEVEQTIAWKNLFLALFVPQRGFLLALPIGLVLLRAWRSRLLDGEATLPAWVEGLLWGALPLVHLHSFVAVSLLGAAWALAAGRIRELLPVFVAAVGPATWAAWQVTDGFRAGGLVGWAPGWMMGPEGLPSFLARNFGFWLPLVAMALALGLRDRRRHQPMLVLLLPALALWVLLFFVRLAPWAWDNTKVMIWCHLAMLPALEGMALARLRVPMRVVALVLLFATGVQTTAWACFGRLPRLDVLERAEYAGVCAALAGVETMRVATVQTFNHPVALCGRGIVAGYSGHLWSHGLQPAETEWRLKELMKGEADWQDHARALDASHIFWGPREEAEFAASKRPWLALGPPVASGAWGSIYSLR